MTGHDAAEQDAAEARGGVDREVEATEGHPPGRRDRARVEHLELGQDHPATVLLGLLVRRTGAGRRGARPPWPPRRRAPRRAPRTAGPGSRRLDADRPPPGLLDAVRRRALVGRFRAVAERALRHAVVGFVGEAIGGDEQLTHELWPGASAARRPRPRDPTMSSMSSSTRASSASATMSSSPSASVGSVTRKRMPSASRAAKSTLRLTSSHPSRS